MSVLIPSLRAAIAVPQWSKDELWRKARAVPSLDLRFADNKSLVDATTGANLVTFSRASSGTYVGSDGLIKTAVTNLLLRSEELDDASWTRTNVLAFGSGSIANATAAPTGAIAADKVTQDTTASAIHRIGTSLISSTSGTYTASVYLKAAESEYAFLSLTDNLTGGVERRINLATGVVDATNIAGSGSWTGISSTVQNAGDGWWRLSVTGTQGAGSFVSVGVFIGNASGQRAYTGDGTSGIYLWGAQLEQSSTVGEYIPTGATINSAPRFDHNPTTGESLGLLVEESRTNLLYPSQFTSFGTTASNNIWYETVAELDATTNSGIAPDGTTTAALLAINTNTAFRAVFNRTGATTQATYSYSVYLKAASTSTSARLFIAGEAALTNNCSAGFTLSGSGSASAATAAGTATAPTAPTIQAVGNGWYRCTLCAALISPSNITCLIYPGTATAQTTASQTFVWGAQLEAGAFPTSYIRSEASAATRAADVASITTLGANVRSLFSQFRSPASGTRPIVSLDDNTANERIELFTSGTDPKLLVTDGGSAQADIDAGAITANTAARFAARFNTDNFAASVSGGAEVLDASGTMPTVDRIRIGRDQAGNYLNGTIARITGWNDPLPMLPPVSG